MRGGGMAGSGILGLRGKTQGVFGDGGCVAKERSLFAAILVWSVRRAAMIFLASIMPSFLGLCLRILPQNASYNSLLHLLPHLKIWAVLTIFLLVLLTLSHMILKSNYTQSKIGASSS